MDILHLAAPCHNVPVTFTLDRMFDISFLASAPEVQANEWRGLRGVAVLGDYSEEFVAAVHEWTRERYEAHWLQAAKRLLGPEARAGFFTDAFQSWWVMWREGETVFVQEHLFLTVIHDRQNVPYEIISERVSYNEDGERISEWEVPAEDVRRFVMRRGQPGVAV